MIESHCDTCGGTANPDNFGSLCDPCEAKRQARTERNRQTLRAHQQERSEFGRAIRA